MKSVLRQLGLLVLVTAAGSSLAIRAEPLATLDQQKLQGRWVCVRTLRDGQEVDNYVGVRAVINGDNLTWYFPQEDGSYREQKNKFRIDAATQPKQFDWWPVDKPETLDRRVYAVSDKLLRMATNLDGQTRPESFESARWQFVCQRAAADNHDDLAATKRSGKVVDPDGDCTVITKDGTMTVKLPAGQHDFWVGEADPAKRFNAPRVLWDVEGNFAAQVKISADWNQTAALPSGRCFYAAGLIVFDSEQQYLRLERCYFIHRVTKALSCFTTPLYDLKGKRVDAERVAEKVSGPESFKGQSTWLRIVRIGQEVSTYISHDGVAWQRNGALATEFPNKVQVGILALNGSNNEFAVEFENFKLKSQ